MLNGIDKNDVYIEESNGKVPSGYSDWNQGATATNMTSDVLPDTSSVKTKLVTGTMMGLPSGFKYPNSNGTFRDLNDEEKESIGTSSIKIDESAINGFKSEKIIENPLKKRELIMNDIENIQNAESFPYQLSKGSDLLTAKYDYRIIPGDIRYQKTKNLESKIKDARASLGIHVHGNNQIARGIKYYMYNRFKVPDKNLAFNKMTTHVFFTRPDLNLLTYNNGSPGTANQQVINHTDASMIWKLNPTLFKLLTNNKRCGDSNNFNFLLSNQITSIDFVEERLNVTENGKSWNDISVAYGDTFTGKQGGTINCNFDETSDLSILYLIRLWMIYIDNVSRGSWSPSYDLFGNSNFNTSNHMASHSYMKELDYAASAYVFKCGPDGEDVLYWTKYYGIFPESTGVNALSWDLNDGIGNRPRLSIPFRYCWKKDLSPISLIEFNENAGISDEDIISNNSFNVNYGHSSRPFVGAPYIEFDMSDNINLKMNGVNYGHKDSHIRLKFRKYSDNNLNDDLLYKYDLSNRK